MYGDSKLYRNINSLIIYEYKQLKYSPGFTKI